mmetsp:Transcript_15934/g.40567  ORF Transcript_15934/g.40567 Transcript_15934/m.40567 type:complete len:278 (+) Transcript_15934:428-1261(+)
MALVSSGPPFSLSLSQASSPGNGGDTTKMTEIVKSTTALTLRRLWRSTSTSMARRLSRCISSIKKIAIAKAQRMRSESCAAGHSMPLTRGINLPDCSMTKLSSSGANPSAARATIPAFSSPVTAVVPMAPSSPNLAAISTKFLLWKPRAGFSHEPSWIISRISPKSRPIFSLAAACSGLASSSGFLSVTSTFSPLPLPSSLLPPRARRWTRWRRSGAEGPGTSHAVTLPAICIPAASNIADPMAAGKSCARCWDTRAISAAIPRVEILPGGPGAGQP